jgi:hypothetical protein
VARPVPRTMALIVLVTICFLACVFLLFVLVQWMRDTKRKTTTRSAVDSEVGETRETKHPPTSLVPAGLGKDVIALKFVRTG